MNILILEDEKGIQRAYRLLLRGHDVRVCSSPKEAHELLAADGWHPDFIFTDWDMPGGTGGDFCVALRQLSRFTSTPIVIVSGQFRDHQAVGATAALLKPFNESDLRRAIESYAK